jgi:hypothetical protein
MKMEQTECSETSAYKIQRPGIQPKERMQHSEHGDSLRGRIIFCVVKHSFRFVDGVHSVQYQWQSCDGVHSVQCHWQSCDGVHSVQCHWQLSFCILRYLFDHFLIQVYTTRSLAQLLFGHFSCILQQQFFLREFLFRISA